MWGFWEGANWIPVSSLYRRDWTPTPAAEAYRDLVYKQWWTNWQGKADANGRCEVRAFYGRHRVVVDGKEKIVELKSVEQTKAVLAQVGEAGLFVVTPQGVIFYARATHASPLRATSRSAIAVRKGIRGTVPARIEV